VTGLVRGLVGSTRSASRSHNRDGGPGAAQPPPAALAAPVLRLLRPSSEDEACSAKRDHAEVDERATSSLLERRLSPRSATTCGSRSSDTISGIGRDNRAAAHSSEYRPRVRTLGTSLRHRLLPIADEAIVRMCNGEESQAIQLHCVLLLLAVPLRILFRVLDQHSPECLHLLQPLVLRSGRTVNASGMRQLVRRRGEDEKARLTSAGTEQGAIAARRGCSMSKCAASRRRVQAPIRSFVGPEKRPRGFRRVARGKWLSVPPR
jgi:hypothetical protein